MRRAQSILVVIGLFMLLSAVMAGIGWRNARADPVLRTARITLPDWQRGARPVRAVLLSDLHVGNGATGPDRLARVVADVNALRPDLILIAGDFFPGDDAVDAATATARLAPLKALRARLGVAAVPGNHDHWTGLAAVRAALTAAGATLLANTAQARGPLVVAAVDDTFSGHADVAKAVAAARRLRGSRVALTHSPDIASRLPRDLPLLLAGHTHCGQVVLPLAGSIGWVKYYEERYRCGIVREGGRAVVVTGGIGGSLPFRIGAPPDLWLLTLGP